MEVRTSACINIIHIKATKAAYDFMIETENVILKLGQLN